MTKIAKYRIIENHIIDEIKLGNLKIGDQIMTEYQLSDKFDIGRLTVNKALINLAKEGYIKRIAGKGSFVINRMVVRDFNNRRSFTQDMESIGLKAGSVLLEYKIITASENPYVARMLDAKPLDKLHYFCRLRTGDDEPIAISYTYVPVAIADDFDVAVLNDSLNDYFIAIGIVDGSTRQKMTAHLPTNEQKKILKIEHEALLRSAHTRFTKDGIAYEYTETYYRSDKFEYTFNSGITTKSDEQ